MRIIGPLSKIYYNDMEALARTKTEVTIEIACNAVNFKGKNPCIYVNKKCGWKKV